MDEDEFIVNSEKPTKLNANKFAAVVCVWWREDRVFVDVYVCVCFQLLQRRSNDLTPDLFCGCVDQTSAVRWMWPHSWRSRYASQLAGHYLLLIQAQVDLAALPGNNHPEVLAGRTQADVSLRL